MAKAFWVAAPGRGEIRDEALGPQVPAGQVRVRSLASAISRGSEGLVFTGRVPESQREVMRCPFQAGAFPAPVKYGYCAVGRVEAGDGALVGRRVFCLHPHQDVYDVPRESVVPVPDEVPDHRATLAANMETAINGLWDAGPRLGDRIAVLGAGAVGMLAAVLAARLPGTRVEMIEPNPSRAAIARALGLRVVAPEAAQGDVDLVIHASGSPEGLATGLRLAGFEATVVEMSWYGDRTVPLPLGEAFHSRRLVLMSSQVGAVAGARRARWTTSRRLALALELLRDAIFDRLIGERIAFAELPAAMPRIVARVDGPPCSVVVYDT